MFESANYNNHEENFSSNVPNDILVRTITKPAVVHNLTAQCWMLYRMEVRIPNQPM
jgi:hypothetical protein